ncbi:MAG: acetylglutamate kinase, partial [Gemmatimonadaceae bacterium]
MSVRVIKLGGRAQSAPDLSQRLRAASETTPVVIVHGGGDEVTALQRQMGVEPIFVHGRRVTRPE